MSEVEPVRETGTIQPDGRTTIPDKTRKALGIEGLKAFFEIETHGRDKAVIHIMTRWTPSKRGRLGKNVVKK